MSKWNKKRIRKLNVATHRDLGYFFSTLIVIYCISGIALNHVDDWDPDFIINKKKISFNGTFTKDGISKADIAKFDKMVGEEDHKVYDFPTHDQVKIYYEDATLHVFLEKNEAMYEQIAKRHVFYESNVLHRNSIKGWKWASDIFAFLLIVITITGLFVLKGKHGITRRGKWFIAAGAIPPLVALLILYLK